MSDYSSSECDSECNTQSCLQCSTDGEICYSYLSTPLCYECYCNQISHYLFDKYFEDLSEEEKEELYDFVFDTTEI